MIDREEKFCEKILYSDDVIDVVDRQLKTNKRINKQNCYCCSRGLQWATSLSCVSSKHVYFMSEKMTIGCEKT